MMKGSLSFGLVIETIVQHIQVVLHFTRSSFELLTHCIRMRIAPTERSIHSLAFVFLPGDEAYTHTL